MLRKLLLGTTATLALALGGQAFADEANTEIDDGSDFNEVGITQTGTTSAVSNVTITNGSDGNAATPSTIDVTQLSDASSTVNMNNADFVTIDVDQAGLSGTWTSEVSVTNGARTAITVNQEDGAGSGGQSDVTVQNGNDNTVSVRQEGSNNPDSDVTITGTNNTANVRQLDSFSGGAELSAEITINGNNNGAVSPIDILQHEVTNAVASIALTGNGNDATIRQEFGSNLTATAEATGDGNTMTTTQTGTDQLSDILLQNGSDDNTITVDQEGSNNISDVLLSNADHNMVTHTQHSVGDTANTTIIGGSNNNVVHVAQN